MLIGMIGGPFSGKTTIAAKMFAHFKELGTNCEFIVEQARQYIAQYRVEKDLLPSDKIELTDKDQQNIALSQMKLEKAMKHSCGINTIILSDSSVLNSSLYMSEDIFNNPKIQNFFLQATNHYDLLFFCHPIPIRVLPNDPNRIHDLNEINSLQNRTIKLLNLVKTTKVPLHELLGATTLESRYRDTCSATLNRHIELLTQV